MAGIPANAGDWLAAVERIFNKAATKNTTKYDTNVDGLHVDGFKSVLCVLSFFKS